MKCCVLGCGSIGRRHIRNLLALGHEVIAWNRSEARLLEVKSLFGIQTFLEINTALSQELDCVYICTPNAYHIDNALTVVKKGIPVLIEKPLSHNLNDLEKLQNIILQKKLISHVGCNMRFHPGPALIKQLLGDGKIGNLYWANLWGGMYLPDWHPQEDYRDMYSSKKSLGGGVLLDFIHEIDLALWLFGSPIKVVGSYFRSGQIEIETEDIADVIFSYSGLQVSLHLDYLQRPFQRGIKVVGDMGSITWDLTRNDVVFTDIIGRAKVVAEFSSYNSNEMYIKQSEYFSRCVSEQKRSFNDISRAIDSIVIVENVKCQNVEAKL